MLRGDRRLMRGRLRWWVSPHLRISLGVAVWRTLRIVLARRVGNGGALLMGEFGADGGRHAAASGGLSVRVLVMRRLLVTGGVGGLGRHQLGRLVLHHRLLGIHHG